MTNNQQERFNTLLELYLADSISEEDLSTLRQVLETPDAQIWLQSFVDEKMEDGSYAPHIAETLALKESGYQQLLKQIEERPVIRHIWRWVAAAAAMLLIISTATYFWPQPGKQITAQEEPAITPGKKGAILTLSNGAKVVLDSLGNGLISTQNGANVLMQNGQLLYDVTGNTNGQMVYNTITTPNGREFHVQLPDGTLVWLNAASSITYPTVFSGKTRGVNITGEAYFEVAKNVQAPFHVNVNNSTRIEVLGTHFNVNAYTNESSINTTLLEGAVRIQSVTLKPGQQAQQRSNADIKIINNANLESVMAWKNGFFNFQGKSLEEVMRQLERWYDLEVIYEKGVPDIRFGGEMSRDMDLKGLLRSLEASKVHFRLEAGRRLIVLP